MATARRKHAVTSMADAPAATSMAQPSVTAGSQQLPLPVSTAPLAAPSAAPFSCTITCCHWYKGLCPAAICYRCSPSSCCDSFTASTHWSMQSFSTSPALALAATVGFIQTSSGRAASELLGGATSTLPHVKSASAAPNSAARGSAAATGAAITVGRTIAPTSHTRVVDLPAAASLPVATQTGATAAASGAQAAAGTVMAKAAAGNEA